MSPSLLVLLHSMIHWAEGRNTSAVTVKSGPPFHNANFVKLVQYRAAWCIMGMLLWAQVAHSLILHRGIWMQIGPHIARKILAHTNHQHLQAHPHCVIVRMHSASKWTEVGTAEQCSNTSRKTKISCSRGAKCYCVGTSWTLALTLCSKLWENFFKYTAEIGHYYPAFLFIQALNSKRVGWEAVNQTPTALKCPFNKL